MESESLQLHSLLWMSSKASFGHTLTRAPSVDS